VTRARVAQRLASAASRRVAFLIAPAGYGKTTALQHFLAEAGEPHVYFALRPQHESLVGFAHGLAAALSGIAPMAQCTIADALANLQRAPSSPQSLANWFRGHLADFTGIIAIDDVQLIDDDPQSVALLASLVDLTRDSIRWIFSARSLRNIPVASWLAYGYTDLPLTDAELALKLDEAVEIASTASPGLPQETVAQLHRLTGGWPTAFRFAVCATETSSDLERAAASTRRLTFQYLADQVYSNLNDDAKTLLTFGALLPEFDVEVLERAGFAGARSTLEDLHRRAAFLSQERDGTYRCHDLFRDFLIDRLLLRGEAFCDGQRRLAAAALAGCGRTLDALRMSVEGRFCEEIFGILTDWGFSFIDCGYGDEIRKALNVLPTGARQDEPLLLGLTARLESDGGRFERAAALLERAIRRCDDRALRAFLILRQSLVLFSLLKSPVDILEPVAFDASLAYQLRGELLSVLVCAYASFGPREKYDRYVAEAEIFCHTVESDIARAKIMQRLGFAAFAAGDGSRAARLSARSAGLAADQGLMKLAASAHAVSGTVAYLYEADLAKAMHFTEREADAGAKAGNPFVVRGTLAAHAAFAAQMGDVQRTDAFLQTFENGFVDDDPRLREMVVQAQALRAMWQHRFDAARGLFERAVSARFAEDRIVNKSFAAMAALLDNGKKDACRLLESAGADRAELDVRSRRYAELAAGLLDVAEALVNRTRPRSSVKHVWPSSCALNRMAGAIARDFSRGAALGSVDEYLSVLRQSNFGGIALALNAVSEALHGMESNSVRLTPRELEVLHLLANGAAPKEIATETKNSVNTIRTHIRSIISKFGCSGKDQAIRLARRRGLIETR
jgi:LuxR family maltose regulon positive regulatory protein